MPSYLKRYLDTCPKNDVISFSRKDFCALGLGLGLELELGYELRLKLGSQLTEIRLNTFSVKRALGQVYYIHLK